MKKVEKLVVRLLGSDLVRRALHTAWQGAFVAWAATGFRTDKVALGAVLGAAASATKTFVVTQVKSREQ